MNRNLAVSFRNYLWLSISLFVGLSLNVSQGLCQEGDGLRVELQNDKSEIYKPKYRTIAHQALELESEIEGIEPDFEILDEIIDEVKRRIKIKPSYSRKEAIDILQTIDDVLVKKNFICKPSHLLVETLKPQKLDVETIAYIKEFGHRGILGRFFKLREMVTSATLISKIRITPKQRDHAFSHLDEDFYFADCYSLSFIYLGAGNALGLPLYGVIAPGHIFVRWQFSNGSYLNWETTKGEIRGDGWYISKFNINESSIRSGVYLRNLKETETLSLCLVKRGKIFHRMGNKEKALADFSKAIELAPKTIAAFLYRGSLWLSEGEHDRALADFNKAIHLDSKSTYAYINRGKAWFDKREPDKALADFNKAIELNRKSIYAYIGRGSTWGYKGNLEKALADFNKAIELDSKVPFPYVGLGNIWWRRGNLDKAIEEYNKAIELDPQYSLAYLNRGMAWDSKGNKGKAIRDYQKAIELKPEYALALNNLAWFYVTSSDSQYRNPREGLKLALKAVELEKKPIFLDTLAAAYADNGDFTRAVEIEREAISLEEDEETKKQFRKMMGAYQQGKTYIQFQKSK